MITTPPLTTVSDAEIRVVNMDYLHRQTVPFTPFKNISTSVEGKSKTIINWSMFQGYLSNGLNSTNIIRLVISSAAIVRLKFMNPFPVIQLKFSFFIRIDAFSLTVQNPNQTNLFLTFKFQSLSHYHHSKLDSSSTIGTFELANYWSTFLSCPMSC